MIIENYSFMWLFFRSIISTQSNPQGFFFYSQINKHISGPPRLPTTGPCLDFGFQYKITRNNQSKKFGLEYWILPDSNSLWRPCIYHTSSKREGGVLEGPARVCFQTKNSTFFIKIILQDQPENHKELARLKSTLLAV